MASKMIQISYFVFVFGQNAGLLCARQACLTKDASLKLLNLQAIQPYVWMQTFICKFGFKQRDCSPFSCRMEGAATFADWTKLLTAQTTIDEVDSKLQEAGRSHLFRVSNARWVFRFPVLITHITPFCCSDVSPPRDVGGHLLEHNPVLRVFLPRP